MPKLAALKYLPAESAPCKFLNSTSTNADAKITHAEPAENSNILLMFLLKKLCIRDAISKYLSAKKKNKNDKAVIAAVSIYRFKDICKTETTPSSPITFIYGQMTAYDTAKQTAEKPVEKIILFFI